ncbi:MAG: class I SAM-dependent methyltransferase, partial [Nannocystaceae bacterium]
MPDNPSRISPTAHYTGQVWCRHELSPAAFGTRFGSTLFTATRPLVDALARFTDGVTLERMLLERHLLLDAQLGAAIETGGVTQVLELASGMSGRGLRMLDRYRDRGLRYIETDLPGMVARKRRALAKLDDTHIPTGGHAVEELNVFANEGPSSLSAVAQAHLDPTRPVAVISEGLLNYFPKSAVIELWERLARLLRNFPEGHYFSDLHVADETLKYWPTRLARRIIGTFARGKVHLHFETVDAAQSALLSAGF